VSGLSRLPRLFRQPPYEGIGGTRAFPISANFAGGVDKPLGLGFVVGLRVVLGAHDVPSQIENIKG
jgi:hypothetical protein